MCHRIPMTTRIATHVSRIQRIRRLRRARPHGRRKESARAALRAARTPSAVPARLPPRATGGPDVRGNFGLVSCLRRACAKARSHFIRVQTGDGVASAAAILALQIVYAELVPTQFCILSGSGYG